MHLPSPISPRKATTVGLWGPSLGPCCRATLIPSALIVSVYGPPLPPALGCPGLVAFVKESLPSPPRRAGKSAGTSVSQPSGIRPANSVCLKCCAVSCFNKEPPGLNWAVTTWKEGAASPPKCQGPCSPTPGPSPRRVLLKTFITTKKSELPDSKFTSWVCPRSERGLPPTGSALACRGPLALNWPRQRTDGWLSEDSQMACGDGVWRAGGVPPLASARSRAAPWRGVGSWSPCG